MISRRSEVYQCPDTVAWLPNLALGGTRPSLSLKNRGHGISKVSSIGEPHIYIYIYRDSYIYIYIYEQGPPHPLPPQPDGSPPPVAGEGGVFSAAI